MGRERRSRKILMVVNYQHTRFVVPYTVHVAGIWICELTAKLNSMDRL